MGNVVLNDLEAKFNKGTRHIEISLLGVSNPHLNLLKHCKISLALRLLGSLSDVRKMYDKFRQICDGKNFKDVTKRTLHEILPFSLTTNCKIYDNFNFKGSRKMFMT